ncbi:MAG TPA: AIR synthase related protein [Acidimicrobiia bacterium]|nr:AIR synthase related protein [Acidimicrobiia bacterium]
MSDTQRRTLDEIVLAVRAHPGLRAKGPIALVADVFGRSDWQAGPGDDGAVVEVAAQGGASAEAGPATLVVGGEAMLPAFVGADPFAAGIAAMLTNVNDLAAMGAEPLALVDTVVASEAVARRVLEGLRHASELYGVPVVGGHLTIQDGPPALSAFGLGRATPGRVLSVRNAAPGQSLLLAGCIEGVMRTDFPFFGSFDARGRELAGDVRTLAAVAASGAAVAAKDVSMAGILGSLGMLLECNGLGVTVDLDALPRPADLDLDLVDWLGCFPCLAFLICAPEGRETECAQRFHDRGLAAEVIGTLDDSGRLRITSDGATATVLDVRTEPVTGLPPARSGSGPPER